MPRLARVVFPGCPHHVTQRGNNRDAVFRSDDDRLRYLQLLGQHSRGCGLSVYGFCLMTNHVHLIAAPSGTDTLATVLRRTHGEYAQVFNLRHGRTGHLWQNRYYSCPVMRGNHFWAAMRYVDLNPVRSGLALTAADWRWSSARAHECGRADEFGLLAMEEWNSWRDRPDWREYLRLSETDDGTALRRATMQGRPFGSETFVLRLERVSGRRLQVQPVGRPRRLRESAMTSVG